MSKSPAQQQTETLIRAYYSAFNSGDSEGMLVCLADGVVHDVNQGERRQGKGRFREFNARMTQSYQETLKDIVIMVSDDGTRAAAEFTVHGVYRRAEAGLPPATGQTYVLPAGTFFAVHNGRISRVTTYYNVTDWLTQVVG